jgi:hypothetical protein
VTARERSLELLDLIFRIHPLSFILPGITGALVAQ